MKWLSGAEGSRQTGLRTFPRGALALLLPQPKLGPSVGLGLKCAIGGGCLGEGTAFFGLHVITILPSQEYSVVKLRGPLCSPST